MNFNPFSRKDDTSSVKPLVVGGSLTAGGLASLKAGYDVDRAEANLYGMYDGVENAKLAPGGAYGKFLNVTDAYGRGGSRTLNSRIAGTRLPYYTTLAANYYPQVVRDYGPKEAILRPLRKMRLNAVDAVFPEEALPHGLREHLRKDTEMNSGLQGLKNHYRSFAFDKEDDVVEYMRRKYLSDARSLSLNPDARKILEDTSLPFSRRLKDMFAVSSAAQSADLRNAVESATRRIAGTADVGGGLAQLYLEGAGRRLPGIAAKLKVGGLLGVGTGLGLAASHLTKSASARDYTDAAGYGTAAVAGGAGLHGLLAAPRVGFSYSEVPKHGDGHKGPGMAMREIAEKLQAEGRISPKVVFENATKSRYGTLHPQFRGRKYDALVDTGMGPQVDWGFANHLKADAAGSEKAIYSSYGGDVKPPRVASGGWVGYMTDAGKFGTPLQGYENAYTRDLNPRFLKSMLLRNFGLKDSYMSWGPKTLAGELEPENLQKLRRLGIHEAHVGDGFPTARGGATSILEEINSDAGDRVSKNRKFISELLASGTLDERQTEKLRGIQGKRIISITGSGRGDYAATRARDLAKELKARGLADKYGIFVQSGGNTANPLNRTLDTLDNVVNVGRIPQRPYVGIPGTSYAHWGSTGASAVGESVATPTRLFYLPEANKTKAREQNLLQRMTRMGTSVDPEFMREHSGVDLDTWNKGNKLWAWRRRGAGKAQTAAQLLGALENMEGSGVEESLRRKSRHMFDLMSPAKANAANHLEKVINRQHLYKRIKGGGLLGLGVAGAGALAHNAAKRREREEWNNSWRGLFKKK